MLLGHTPGRDTICLCRELTFKFIFIAPFPQEETEGQGHSQSPLYWLVGWSQLWTTGVLLSLSSSLAPHWGDLTPPICFLDTALRACVCWPNRFVGSFLPCLSLQPTGPSQRPPRGSLDWGERVCLDRLPAFRTNCQRTQRRNEVALPQPQAAPEVPRYCAGHLYLCLGPSPGSSWLPPAPCSAGVLLRGGVGSMH